LGDVIVAVDGKKIRSQQDLFDVFETAGVGATVKLSVAVGRSDKRRDVRVKLYDLR
jgi:S1-C subfamily serine protease